MFIYAGFISIASILFSLFLLFAFVGVVVLMMIRLSKWVNKHTILPQKTNKKVTYKKPWIISLLSCTGGVLLIVIEHATRRPQDYPFNPPSSIWLRIGAGVLFIACIVAASSPFLSSNSSKK